MYGIDAGSEAEICRNCPLSTCVFDEDTTHELADCLLQQSSKKSDFGEWQNAVELSGSLGLTANYISSVLRYAAKLGEIEQVEVAEGKARTFQYRAGQVIPDFPKYMELFRQMRRRR